MGTGFQEGGGLHLDAPLYTVGLHRGEIRSADADVEAAVADAQAILDLISLQVNLAYRGVVASRERINLARTAVVQAGENLRLLEVRYRNGDATPTDIVDSEAALTRSQQRYFSATYTYLAFLARVDYALGQQPGASLRGEPEASPAPLPPRVERQGASPRGGARGIARTPAAESRPAARCLPEGRARGIARTPAAESRAAGCLPEGRARGIVRTPAAESRIVVVN